MKAVINGVRFNTDTATRLGDVVTVGKRSDLHYWSAGLYQTPRSRQWFLAGCGGIMSRFAKFGSCWLAGELTEAVWPLDVDEAEAWARAYLPRHVVRRAFLRPVEAEPAS